MESVRWTFKGEVQTNRRTIVTTKGRNGGRKICLTRNGTKYTQVSFWSFLTETKSKAVRC